MILITVTCLLLVAYSLLIAFITIGWWRLKNFVSSGSVLQTKISVVVAVRNEEENIQSLFNSLLSQDYSSQLYEIIVIDDHSDDNTAQNAKQFLARHESAQNLRFLILPAEHGEGKKAALDYAIRISTGELIVITDADCTAGSKWISTLASFYSIYKCQMILGPVSMNDNQRFFSKLQSLEFMSLISSAAGACNAGFPILANGANMAFSRLAYNTCGGFTGNTQYPSGDDMFLMQGIKKQFGAKAIRFLRSGNAIVNTPAANGLKAFYNQRKRWVSKSRGYTDPLLIAASVLVFLVNAWLVTLPVLTTFFPGNSLLFVAMLLLKLLIDFPLMFSFSRFQRSHSILWLFPLMELLNAMYTLIIGIAGNTGKYEWKGRKVSSGF